jgi:hypothetical protein
MGKDKRQSPSTLLWFIRHKSYVPISEIRRRFLIDTDDGTFIEAGSSRRAYVGLPSGTAQSLEKLWKQGKIGFELSAEFDACVLIGVYPMNPSKEDVNGNGHAHPVHRQFAIDGHGIQNHSNGGVHIDLPPSTDVPLRTDAPVRPDVSARSDVGTRSEFQTPEA